MKIYVSHSRAFNFRDELYTPLKKSELAARHQFIFPHDVSDDPYPSKQLFTDKGCDLILAEVSYPSTGQGIELGWANKEGIRIVCIYKQSSKISGSLSEVSKDFLEYKGSTDLVGQIEKLSILQ